MWLVPSLGFLLEEYILSLRKDNTQVSSRLVPAFKRCHRLQGWRVAIQGSTASPPHGGAFSTYVT